MSQNELNPTLREGFLNLNARNLFTFDLAVVAEYLINAVDGSGSSSHGGGGEVVAVHHGPSPGVRVSEGQSPRGAAETEATSTLAVQRAEHYDPSPPHPTPRRLMAFKQLIIITVKKSTTYCFPPPSLGRMRTLHQSHGRICYNGRAFCPRQVIST